MADLLSIIVQGLASWFRAINWIVLSIVLVMVLGTIIYALADA